MYVAAVPNRYSRAAILLRECFRQNGQVKSRTLANLSSWRSKPVDAQRRLLRGELVIGLLTEREGEPPPVRVLAGNTNDPVTVAD
jgi:hypothetical protein